jgi:hypothetical protein
MQGKLTVNKKTGTSAYEIADYLMKKHGLEEAVEQFKCKVAESLKKNNENNYRFPMGFEINAPEDMAEIIDLVDEWLPALDESDGNTTSQQGWMLTTEGRLVRGETGWLVDENGLYILKDGRRLNNIEGDLGIGKEEVWPGLDEILGIDSRGANEIEGFPRLLRASAYDTLVLFNNYGFFMNAVVYQAFQINICYQKTNAYAETQINNDSRKVFYSIGRDETNIPIVATRIVGSESSVDPRIPSHEHEDIRISRRKTIIIAGPHGDERNAQRLIMAAQKHFIRDGAPADTNMYFIPCLSPTMAFADARGIPVVDEDGNNEGITTVLNKLTIPYLHDLIATEVPRKPEKSTAKKLLRSLIQTYNGTAFASFADYPNNISNTYPLYGIDANRDVQVLVNEQKALPSTQSFIGFIRTLGSSQNIKVIMVHGYYRDGGVFGQYEIKMGTLQNRTPGPVAVLVDGAQNFAYAFWNYLFRSTPDPFFPDTEFVPLKFAGEWSQILHEKFRILSVDVELVRDDNNTLRNFDEGCRGDSDREYGPGKVREDKDFESGVLEKGPEPKGSFYELLETYRF